MPSLVIDFRSDACSLPTDAMRTAMAQAEIGNDDFGDDPSIRRLEARIALDLGKEAALFVQSGTMANLLAVMSNVEPGQPVLISRRFHIFDFEEAAMHRVAGCSFQFFEEQTAGGQTQIDVDALVQGTGDGGSPRLLCLENSINRLGGTIIPLDSLREAAQWAQSRGLPVHLDGARLFNAACTLRVAPGDIAACADTVMVVFTKALCAPAGAALVGTKDVIERARRFRWMLGGAWKQGGVLAAGCLAGLQALRDRIPDDHRAARRLAEGLVAIDGFDVNLDRVVTNIVFLQVTDPDIDLARLTSFLKERGALFGRFKQDRRCRLVTHRGTDMNAVERFLEWTRAAVREQRAHAS